MKGSGPLLGPLLRPLPRPLLTETPIDLERICPRQPKNVSSRICHGRCSTRCFSHQRENHWTQNKRMDSKLKKTWTKKHFTYTCVKCSSTANTVQQSTQRSTKEDCNQLIQQIITPEKSTTKTTEH